MTVDVKSIIFVNCYYDNINVMINYIRVIEFIFLLITCFVHLLSSYCGICFPCLVFILKANFFCLLKFDKIGLSLMHEN
ncbi:uncharacterized protein Smp_200210 [Schistosoma mansoni]|uniref:Smp_200210 n=1 Tax=Schistosoma mansoni TaxID=6183 RepID=G4VBA0_SCHMA|nr:uncharacterized protein Smp_200210 [Schistosoma mansoni]|eukprot:XP_018649482.1 uncharacterized protein Smp_200210 [Schistosoma mansoni]